MATKKLNLHVSRTKQDLIEIKDLRPQKIQEGDWVLVLDNSLDNQYITNRKFARRWFRPYEVRNVTNTGAYYLCE